MKMLMNWLNQIGQIISDGNRSYPCFFLEKRKEEDVGKKKAVSPRLAFPFCLKTAVKQGKFQKKKKCTFRN